MQEKWKDVVIDGGMYADRYQVSNLGRVRAHINAKIKGSKPGRILFQSEDDRGYKQVLIYYQRRQHTVKVHRLVATSFLGPRNGLTVNHIDGDKSNNCVSNLEYITNLENCRHAHRTIDSRSGIVIDGQKMSIPEATEKYAAEGVNANAVSRRINRFGWSPIDALKTPIQKTGRPTKENQYVRK